MIPMAMAGGGQFVTMPLTRHSTTNISIIQMFWILEWMWLKETAKCMRSKLESPFKLPWIPGSSTGSGQASRNDKKEIWIPAFAGMTWF